MIIIKEYAFFLFIDIHKTSLFNNNNIKNEEEDKETYTQVATTAAILITKIIFCLNYFFQRTSFNKKGHSIINARNVYAEPKKTKDLG